MTLKITDPRNLQLSKIEEEDSASSDLCELAA